MLKDSLTVYTVLYKHTLIGLVCEFRPSLYGYNIRPSIHP